jgi:enoyl-CoA hydratase/carnithine racemase
VQRLAERIGRSRAARYAMLCEPMSGVTAGELGIATLVVPADDVEAAALKFAQDLSTGPTRSYAAIRTLLKAWSGGGVPTADAMILDITMALHSSEDARRGRTARAEAIKKGIEPPKIVFTGR